MLGVTALIVAMPLAHHTVAYAEDGESGDDDAGPLLEGCNVEDAACIIAQPVK
jgi:hypothetical protein